MKHDPTQLLKNVLKFQEGYYGVYADVGYYKPWLDAQFAANGGINLTPQPTTPAPQPPPVPPTGK